MTTFEKHADPCCSAEVCLCWYANLERWITRMDNICSRGLHIDILVRHIQEWYDTGGIDMDECDLMVTK
jgi:hypothetical protein